MNKLFFGLLMVFLHLKFTVNGAHTLYIFPQWMGYCLIYSGLNDMADQGEHFRLAKPWCLGMAAYTGVTWLLNLILGEGKLGIVSWALELIAALVSLYVSYMIIRGIGEIEQNRGVSLEQPRLEKVWKLLLVCDIATYALILLPALAVIAALVAFVAGIVFLVRFNRTRRLYNTLPAEQ